MDLSIPMMNIQYINVMATFMIYPLYLSDDTRGVIVFVPF